MTRKLTTALLTAGALLTLFMGTAGAQQLIDAGRGHVDGSGGLAFVVFTIMVFVIGAALFYMDRIRRRSSSSPD
jgi:hypothetical protein